MIYKKLIKENPKEFSAWLRELPVTLYSRSKNMTWTEDYDWEIPKNCNSDFFVVLQDKYIEFRIAMKMDKPIYHKDEGSEDVTALIRVGGFRNQPDDYSLIPFNEKVKVGDYVREKGSKDYYTLITDINQLPHPEDILEIWKPVIGEVMIFHADNDIIAVIGKLHDILDDGFYTADWHYNKVSPLTFSLDYLDKGGVDIDDL